MSAIPAAALDPCSLFRPLLSQWEEKVPQVDRLTLILHNGTRDFRKSLIQTLQWVTRVRAIVAFRRHAACFGLATSPQEETGRSGLATLKGYSNWPDPPRTLQGERTMLVLSRKLNEKIVIDGGIVVTVVKIDRNQARLGIEAPGHIPVFREEILPASIKQRHDEAVAAGS